jgi:hypothetical protein
LFDRQNKVDAIYLHGRPEKQLPYNTALLRLHINHSQQVFLWGHIARDFRSTRPLSDSRSNVPKLSSYAFGRDLDIDSKCWSFRKRCS